MPAASASPVGAESPALATAVDEICALLALRSGGTQSRGALEGHLRALGVDSRSSSLQRFGGQVVYALGDTSDDKFAQLWVYKQSFQPARMRWTAKDGTRWDVWLVDYGAPPAGEAFPRVIEVHRNGERQLRFDALDLAPRSEARRRPVRRTEVLNGEARGGMVSAPAIQP